ncbi:MAG: 50S ribosomal protein P1, partial [Candidatus Altiarchaeota archaeon]|nr:50S ribosomal protein P1 [Candidatus Altiarchaeota archaeon]
MEYIYAALLIHKAGKKVTEDALKKVLTAAGVTAEDARLKALVSAIKDVDIEEAISTPIAVATTSVVAPAGSGDAKPAAEKKEEEPEEDKGKKEEEAAAGLAAL